MPIGCPIIQIWAKLRGIPQIWVNPQIWVISESDHPEFGGSHAWITQNCARRLPGPHGPKNRRVGSDFGKITRPVTAIKSLRFVVFFSSLFCSLSEWWMHFMVFLASDFLVGTWVVWHGSGNFNLKENSSLKMPFKTHSISVTLTC